MTWCWLSTYNKVKSEQCFAVTSAKRVAVLPSQLKGSKRRCRCPTFQKEITSTPHPKDQTVYEKEEAVNKNDALLSK